MNDDTQNTNLRQLLEYKAIFENAAVGILYTRDRIFGRCNARAASLLGYLPTELEGLPGIAIYPSDESYAEIGRQASPLLAAGEAFQAEWQFKRSDGELIWCKVYARAVDPNHTDAQTVWILEDVTKARALSASHAAAAADMQAIMDNASVAVIFTRDRKIFRHNPKFAELFGYPGDTALGLPGRALYRSDEEYMAIGQLAGPLLSAGKPFQHELFMRRADNSDLWVSLIGYVLDLHDPTRGTIWLIEDRSAYKAAAMALEENLAQLRKTNQQLEAAQNQLLQSEKLASIGQLAAGVAHEINNPIGFVNSNLGTLSNYSEQLLALVAGYERVLQHLPVPDALAENLKEIRQSADLDFLREDIGDLLRESQDGLKRVRQIIQDLKDFSHVDSGEWKPTDLNHCLLSTLNVVSNELKYKAVVERALGDLPEVYCNAPQINQVMMNLMVNAAQAMTSKGTIVLRTGVGGERVWFEVEDSGCGIPEPVRTRMFEPFFTTKPVGKGTGLGLSVSYGIVSKHAGEIEVESAVGKGTRIRVWLPIAGVAPPPDAS
jgi:PAS domain S-box-containing protein